MQCTCISDDSRVGPLAHLNISYALQAAGAAIVFRRAALASLPCAPTAAACVSLAGICAAMCAAPAV